MKHVKKFEAIYSEDEDPNIKSEAEYWEKRISDIAQDAQDRFWSEVADNFHASISGDFPPDAQFEFDAACEKAIKIWIEGNVDEFDSDEFYGVDNKQL